jgi:hypothetical protein
MGNGLPFDPLDPQRDLVYRAERKAFGKTEVLGLDELRAFAKEIQTAGWWQRTFPGKKVPPIKDGRGSEWARRNDGALHAPRKCRRKDLLVHEIGHEVMPPGVEWHGEAFCGVALFLYGKAFGGDAKDRVRREFRAAGARWDVRLARYGSA